MHVQAFPDRLRCQKLVTSDSLCKLERRFLICLKHQTYEYIRATFLLLEFQQSHPEPPYR